MVFVNTIGCLVFGAVLVACSQIYGMRREMRAVRAEEALKDKVMAEAIKSMQKHAKAMHEQAFIDSEERKPSAEDEISTDWQRIVSMQIDWARPESLWDEAVAFLRERAPNDAAFRWGADRLLSAMLETPEESSTKPLAEIQAFKPQSAPKPQASKEEKVRLVANSRF